MAWRGNRGHGRCRVCSQGRVRSAPSDLDYKKKFAIKKANSLCHQEPDRLRTEARLIVRIYHPEQYLLSAGARLKFRHQKLPKNSGQKVNSLLGFITRSDIFSVQEPDSNSDIKNFQKNLSVKQKFAIKILHRNSSKKSKTSNYTKLKTSNYTP